MLTIHNYNKLRINLSLEEIEYLLFLLRHDTTIAHTIDMENGDERQQLNVHIKSKMITGIIKIKKQITTFNEYQP